MAFRFDGGAPLNQQQAPGNQLGVPFSWGTTPNEVGPLQNVVPESPLLPDKLQHLLSSVDESSPSFAILHYFYNRIDGGGVEPSIMGELGSQPLPMGTAWSQPVTTATNTQPLQSTLAPPPCPPPPLDQLWQEAIQNNPDAQKFQVVPVAGFRGLYTRASLQRDRVKECLHALDHVESRLNGTRGAYQERIGSKIQQARHMQNELERKTIDVIGLVESTLLVTSTMPSHTFGNLSTPKHSVIVKRNQNRESELRQRLEELAKRFHSTGVEDLRQFCERNRNVVHRAPSVMRSQSWATNNRANRVRVRPVHAAAAESLRNALEREREGIEKLMEVVRSDAKAMEMLQNSLNALRGSPNALPLTTAP